MLKIKKYFCDVIMIRMRTSTPVFIGMNILLYICTIFCFAFLGYRLFCVGLREYSIDVVNHFYYGAPIVLVCMFLNTISTTLEKFSKGKEIIFLKSLGFDTKELLGVLFLKQYKLFLLFTGLYFLIGRGIEKFNLLFLIKSLLEQFMAFGILLIISIGYNTLKNKYIDLLKNGLLLIILIYFGQSISRIFLEGKFKILGGRDVLIHILSELGDVPVVRYVVDSVYKFGIVQSIIFFTALLIFYIFFYKRAFELKGESKFRIKLFSVDRLTGRLRKKSNSPFKAFLRRDFIIMIRRKSFLLIQTFFVLGFIFLLGKIEDISTSLILGFMFCFILMNSLLSQESIKVDAEFSKLYLQLPIGFKTFILSKVASTALISLMVPVLLLIEGMLLNRINFKAFLVVLGIEIILALVLALYFCSIIIAFYPKVNKTDLPLVISVLLLFFLPGISLLLVFVAFKRGRSQWMKWKEIY